MYNVPPITYSKKYLWLTDARHDVDLKFFQMKLRQAVKEHNKKMDKHNDTTTI